MLDGGAMSGDEGAARGFDDVAGDDGQVVDPHDSLDLSEEPVDQAEVPSGDAADAGYSLGIGKSGEVQDCLDGDHLAADDAVERPDYDRLAGA